jgi:superfamily II DNA or RNA helicase
MIDVLRYRWLPTAKVAVVNQLVATIQLTLAGQAAKQTLATKKDSVTFVQRRNVTTNLTVNVRKAFIAAHKLQREVDLASPGELLLAGPVALVGLGEPLGFEWYSFQRTAQRELDRLLQSDELHARLVLPTGSGKTDTVVGWLLNQMARDSELRVLWLVHQQELAAQAISRFRVLTTNQQPGFKSRARAIYSGANALSTLADDETAVAALTYQSFKNLDVGKRPLLKRFLARPTIVVVDEAHHAGAPTYESLLDAICDEPKLRGVLGLTATPYPSGAGAKQRFQARFRHLVHEVSIFELVRDGILARPYITTFDTRIAIEMTDREVRRAEEADLPPDVLSQLDDANRNRLVVQAWKDAASRWGKTLVFAVTIAHADALALQMRRAGATVRALHSRTPNRLETLTWFRNQPATGRSMLVSVGMLTEGVDLPDARTAFLARPTTSPILMRQMVGRVLRGPQAGGEPSAHVVYFRDDWRNMPDVLQPEEVLPATSRLFGSSTDVSWTPGDLVTDAELIHREALALQVARALSRLRSLLSTHDLDPFNDVPLDPLLREARIVGYYEIDDQQVPVLDHQVDGFARLLEAAVRDDLKGVPFLSYFEGDPPPYPPKRALKHLVELAREYEEPPELRQFGMTVSPRALAQQIFDDDLSAHASAGLVAAAYADPLAQVLYRSVDALDEAVVRELRQLRLEVRLPESEQCVPVAIDPAKLPKLPRSQRDLVRPLSLAVSGAHSLLPVSIADRVIDPPKVDWTGRVTSSTFAHWSLKLVHANKGQAAIRVNRLLRAPKKVVSEELLGYLVYHELLHHLLPGQGHDPEFRDYEARWPGAMDHNLWLDTLHEHWDTRPPSYNT